MWNGPDTGAWADVCILQRIEAYQLQNQSHHQSACISGPDFPKCDEYCGATPPTPPVPPNPPCSLPKSYSPARLSGPTPIPAVSVTSLETNAFYVDSVKGVDTNEGTEQAPFQTLLKAQTAAQTLHQTIGSSTPVTLYLRDTGVFTLTSPLVLTSVDSYTNWQSYPGEQAVISGGAELAGLKWTKTPENDGTYQTPIPPGLKFDALYVDGERAIRARFPNGDPLVPGDGFTLTV